MGAAHAGGKPLKASQRRLGRARARGKPPATAAPTVGAAVRWRGHSGTVARLDGGYAVVLLDDGKRWQVPIAELEPV
jgi:hypothetical protein